MVVLGTILNFKYCCLRSSYYSVYCIHDSPCDVYNTTRINSWFFCQRNGLFICNRQQNLWALFIFFWEMALLGCFSQTNQNNPSMPSSQLNPPFPYLLKNIACTCCRSFWCSGYCNSFLNQVSLFQHRSTCFNPGQFGAGAKGRSQVVVLLPIEKQP